MKLEFLSVLYLMTICLVELSCSMQMSGKTEGHTVIMKPVVTCNFANTPKKTQAIVR